MGQNISPAASSARNTGMVATTLWGSDTVAGIAVDPDGNIWLGAYSRLGLGGEEDSGFTASVVRFNADGSLDRNFSADGKSLLLCRSISRTAVMAPSSREGATWWRST